MGVEAIGGVGIFRRTPAADACVWSSPLGSTGCKDRTGRPVLVAAKHVGFSFWPSTTLLSPAVHMDTVGPAYHMFQLMTQSPMLLVIRWAHKHTTGQSSNALLPYPTSPHHLGAAEPSYSDPIASTSCPYRALTASLSPRFC